MALSTFAFFVKPNPHAFIIGATVTSKRPPVFSETSRALSNTSVKYLSAITAVSFLLILEMMEAGT
jgi:hypothetical protein